MALVISIVLDCQENSYSKGNAQNSNSNLVFLYFCSSFYSTNTCPHFWGKINIDIYVKTYTEEEIRAISEFYKSQAGKKFIDKMPQLMQESMAISQKRMPTLMKKVQKINEEMVNKIKQQKE